MVYLYNNTDRNMETFFLNVATTYIVYVNIGSKLAYIGLPFPFTESDVTVECSDVQKRPWLYCTDAQADIGLRRV